ncbi:BNR repeat-containing protein [Streptomyces marincola]|uniref:BNR repeat-containing protein n=1 Tax=Streptomyces marincola TaxID=2878388 RepID=UPI001CF4051E|nr:BNR repeat-containing protein [Streptomyces marincola]UCM91109.1 BNR repeat-containing protein [Streptomyces marincola]
MPRTSDPRPDDARPRHDASRAPGPSVTPLGSTLLDPAALYFVSYDGLVNNNAFQKNGLLTHAGHQYAVWYTADRTAVVARRTAGGDDWRTVRLGHRLGADDSHNVICAGVSPADGRLHLVMDAHSSDYRYVASVPGLMDDPGAHAWRADAFGPARDSLGGLRLTSAFTYPQFLPTPGGRLLLSYRTGISGNGRAALAEYDAGRWTDLGCWSDATGTYATARGASGFRNLYLHGLDYGPDGTLHVFGTWREQSRAVTCGADLTNHDTVYVSSPDDGRTWYNAAGTRVARTGSTEVGVGAPGLVVDPLGPDHALMNQESQAVDSRGLPHALISHVPDRFGPCATGYVAERTARARAFHLRRAASGGWRKTEIPVPLRSSQRSQLVLDAYDNAYAVLPYGRIAAASAAGGWADWALVWDGSEHLGAFGEVVVDHTRVRQDGVLSFLYQERSTGTTPSPLRVADFRLPG